MSDDNDLAAPTPPKKTIDQLRAEAKDRRRMGRLAIPSFLKSGNLLQSCQTMMKQASPEQQKMMNNLLGSSITETIKSASSNDDLEKSLAKEDINKIMGKFQNVMQKAGPEVQHMADKLSEQVIGSKELVTNVMVARDVTEVEILMKGTTKTTTTPLPVPETESKKKKNKKKKKKSKLVSKS